MILRLLKKIAHFCLIQQLFIRFFRNISILTYPIYIQFVCYVDFQKLKKDIENLFSSCCKVNFREKHILAIFRIIFQNIDIISDVIIAIAAILKFFSTNFFVTLESMIVPNFISKAFFYQDLGRRVRVGHYCPLPPLGHDQTKKYPGADRVNPIAFYGL